MIGRPRALRPGRPVLCAPFLGALVVLALLPSPARAQAALEGRVARITLDNGMRFLVLRRGTAPVFSANLRFKVGGVDDRAGATGLAHMFEHMAFKGTSTIGTRDAAREAEILDAMDVVVRDLHRELDRGVAADAARLETLRGSLESLKKKHQDLLVKDELVQILTRNGAEGMNASTGEDLTSYVVSLPANRLELWCLLESARLRDPVLREFYAERDVVMEERRFRVDNQPQGKLYEALLNTAFAAHPYRVSTSGWMSDLERLTRPQAAAFHDTYYVPGNAVGALVGDVDPVAAERLVRRYFGGLKAGPAPPPVVTVEPPQTGERRVNVVFDAEPQLMIAFHKPCWPDPDAPVFEVIDSLLTSGRTSRLFKALVLDTQVASDVFSFEAPGQRYPNLFVIGGEPRAPHTASEIEAGLLKELRRLAEEPAGEREIQKIRNQVEAALLYPLRSNQGLASQLTFFEILEGDWRRLNDYYAAVRAVGAERVQEVARRTFTPANRTIASLVKP
ncbi:MAG TPA: pitrilysin family protein [Candidatus Polarisedimenticolia bacterium]|nr:pitrilysin family protein [Candidatus Polarisedimenticolia bacterium]